MLKPPFKLATAALPTDPAASAADAYRTVDCCAAEDATTPIAVAQRARLGDLDPHLHCSVLGTCLGTAELRKLMARFVFVRDESDLGVHHEAVRMAALGGPVAKALHKALEQRHEAAIQRCARVHDAEALTALWEEAMRLGEIPGTYWALLTHRQTTAALRQRIFGDVHMLSHLVGAANRADIRRLVALERDNAELHERIERQQQHAAATLDERDRLIADLRRELADGEAARAAAQAARRRDPPGEAAEGAAETATKPAAACSAERIALQTERRERAEQAAAVAADEAARLRRELDHLGRHAQTLGRELAAAETQLRRQDGEDASRAITEQLRGRRILYVGGRPSSTPAIRDLVLRHGGEFQRHDGGLEDRKGLLTAAISWAGLVVFPVDCIDHDSAGNLKRLCARQQVGFVPLRSASVASFAAAFSGAPPETGPGTPGGGLSSA